MISFTNTFASGSFPVAAFYAYTVLARRPLRIEIAFPALQLFNMLESSLREIPRLIMVLLNANVAVSRMTSFMNEPDKDLASAEIDSAARLDQSSDTAITDMVTSREPPLALENACFAWPGVSYASLIDITLTFPVGMTLVCGKVGGGKTALLQGLLGELDLRAGRAVRSRATVGYCAQTPWVQSMSIRENIIFFLPYDRDRYTQVLDACALTPDLASFKDGDLSEVGESGVGLSGGQRMRIALARAVSTIHS